MILSALAVVLALNSVVPADTVLDPVPVYASVLEDLRSRFPVSQIVLDQIVWNLPLSSPRTRVGPLPAEATERLRKGGWIDALSCGTDERCLDRSGGILVSLSPVVPLPDTARVQIWPEGATSEQVRAQPTSAAVPVDVFIDVVLEGSRCKDCWYASMVSYRYYLSAKPNGTYTVVTRWQTGAT